MKGLLDAIAAHRKLMAQRGLRLGEWRWQPVCMHNGQVFAESQAEIYCGVIGSHPVGMQKDDDFSLEVGETEETAANLCPSGDFV